MMLYFIKCIVDKLKVGSLIGVILYLLYLWYQTTYSWKSDVEACFSESSRCTLTSEFYTVTEHSGIPICYSRSSTNSDTCFSAFSQSKNCLLSLRITSVELEEIFTAPSVHVFFPFLWIIFSLSAVGIVISLVISQSLIRQSMNSSCGPIMTICKILAAGGPLSIVIAFLLIATSKSLRLIFTESCHTSSTNPALCNEILDCGVSLRNILNRNDLSLRKYETISTALAGIILIGIVVGIYEFVIKLPDEQFQYQLKNKTSRITNFINKWNFKVSPEKDMDECPICLRKMLFIANNNNNSHHNINVSGHGSIVSFRNINKFSENLNISEHANVIPMVRDRSHSCMAVSTNQILPNKLTYRASIATTNLSEHRKQAVALFLNNGHIYEDSKIDCSKSTYPLALSKESCGDKETAKFDHCNNMNTTTTTISLLEDTPSYTGTRTGTGLSRDSGSSGILNESPWIDITTVIPGTLPGTGNQTPPLPASSSVSLVSIRKSSTPLLHPTLHEPSRHHHPSYQYRKGLTGLDKMVLSTLPSLPLSQTLSHTKKEVSSTIDTESDDIIPPHLHHHHPITIFSFTKPLQDTCITLNKSIHENQVSPEEIEMKKNQMANNNHCNVNNHLVTAAAAATVTIGSEGETKSHHNHDTNHIIRLHPNNSLDDKVFENNDDDSEGEVVPSIREEDYELAQVPCGHIFHKSCIMEWGVENNTCPVCRANLEGILYEEGDDDEEEDNEDDDDEGERDSEEEVRSEENEYYYDEEKGGE